MIRSWHAIVLGLPVIFAAVAWLAVPAGEPDPAPAQKRTQADAPADKPKDQADDKSGERGREDLPLREYMRVKLEASNLVLEGLCTEDAKLVERGARKLNEMSTSERWRVINDPMYRQFSADFREITQQLVEAAEKHNLDRAALKWMDATMGCIECHRFVRGIRIADQPDQRKSSE